MKNVELGTSENLTLHNINISYFRTRLKRVARSDVGTPALIMGFILTTFIRHTL